MGDTEEKPSPAGGERADWGSEMWAIVPAEGELAWGSSSQWTLELMGRAADSW